MRRFRDVLALATCAATLTLGLAPAAAAPAPGALVQPAASSANGHGQRSGELRAAMRDAVDAGATGVIARVDDRKRVARVAVGLARLDPERHIRTSDQVRVGSITKPMVSVVALQLVGEGRLRLSDTVQRWLPGLVPNGDQITIRMLLNHTSGVYNYTDDPGFFAAVAADPSRRWSPHELVAIATSHDPNFAPGTNWSYSNTGYILAGLVLEKVTGTPLHRLLDKRVIRPLRLHDTYLPTSVRFRGSHAHGYFPPSLTGAGYVDVSRISPSVSWAAGGVVSNAPDLDRFLTALMSGRLLDRRLLAEMTKSVDTGAGFGYGLGIVTADTECGTVWGHEGGVPGYLSFAYTDRRGSRSSVVLVPTEPDEAIRAAADRVLATAVCQMFGEPVPGGGVGGRSAAQWRSLATG